MTRVFRSIVAAALLCLLLAVASVSVSAQTTLSSPAIPVAPNTGTTFVSAGFRPGELVSLWTTAPDTSVTPLDGVTADSRGAVTAPVTFPTTGTWNVTAHGQTSGAQVIGTFAVGVTSAQPVPGTTLGALPALPTQGGNGAIAPPSISFPQVALGAAVILTGSGLTANEPLAFWETAPNSTVTPIQGQPTADATGAFTLTIPFLTAGFWQVTAHGITSGHEVIGRYVVGDTAASAGLPGSAVAPTSTTATAATVGRSIAFTASGFSAGERIAAWATAPDTTVTPLNQAYADGNGGVTIVTSFPTVGAWQVTVHGIDSGHETIGQYQVATA